MSDLARSGDEGELLDPGLHSQMEPTPAVVSQPAPFQHVSGEVRADIQGLRALAVILVVVHHFWTPYFEGGHLGVDVFFVVSGYLITLHLIGRPPLSGRELAQFWGRRIRRLLPAATVVLLATLALAALLTPGEQARAAAQHAIAASLYVENWAIQWDISDGAATSPPIQHFWSLSVEEQFYLIWPILIATGFLMARRKGEPHRWLALLVGGLIVVSFGLQAYGSAAIKGWVPSLGWLDYSYYGTQARLWELATGGLAAVMVTSGAGKRFVTNSRVRLMGAWSGTAFVLIAALGPDLPLVNTPMAVVGSVLVILANSDRDQMGPGLLWRNSAVQTVGDVSYSLYLWHLPVYVFAVALMGTDIPALMRLLLIALALGIALGSKRWVEDPFRRAPGLVASLPRTYLFGAALIVTVVGVALLVSGTNAP